MPYLRPGPRPGQRSGRYVLVAILVSGLVFLALADVALAGFQPQQTFPTDLAPTSVAVADLNGDGKPDLVTANNSSNTVSVLLGNGNGTFQTHQTFTVGTLPSPLPASVAIADLNNDGRPDLAVANQGSPPANSTVSVLLGNGDGTFQAHSDFAVEVDPVSVAIADLNGDTRPDLAVVNINSGTVSVLLGNGNGTFQPQTSYFAGSSPFGIAIADLNSDGKPDFVTTDFGSVLVWVLLGNGDGTFQSATGYVSGFAPTSVAIADLNGDARLDLAVANDGDDNVGVLLGNGDGTFQAPLTFTAVGARSVKVADLNGDGKPDLAVTRDSGNIVNVLLGVGDGTFQSATPYTTGTAPVSLAATDLNGDGKPDLVTANASGANSNSVSVLLALPSGALQFGSPTFTVGEGGGTINVTVTRTGSTDGQVSAIVSHTGGTATQGTDFTFAAPQTVTWTDGDGASKSVSIPITQDAVDEADETIQLTLTLPTNPAGATIGAQSTTTVTITDDDTAGLSVVQTGGATDVSEAGATDTFTVALTSQPTASVTVTVNADIQSQVANDGVTFGGTTPLTFTTATWSTPQTVTVRAIDDVVAEGSPHNGSITFTVTGADVTYSGLVATPVAVNITDNEAAGLNIGDGAVTEGDSGTAALVFVVVLTPQSAQTVTVQYATADGTATGGGSCAAGVDYQSTSGTLTFLTGETSKTVTVSVCGDALVEGNETIFVNLTNPTNAGIADTQARGTVTDDDQGGTLSLSAATATVRENAGSLTLTVERTGVQQAGSGTGSSGRRRAPGSVGTAALAPVTVQYTTSDGTAQAGKDYTATSGTLSLGANETSKTITIPIRDDADSEPSETFTMTISNASGGASLGSTTTVTVTIIDTSVTSSTPQGQDDTDPSRKNTNAKDGKDTTLTEEQQRQQQHTNRGNRDDVATEGDVIEVHTDATPPYIVIANRDGPVRVNLLCGGQCPAIKVGDYVQIDGEKQHESLYDAEQVTVAR